MIEVDTTVPTLSDGGATHTSETAATVQFTSSEAGTCYYEVVESGANTISLTTLSGTGAFEVGTLSKAELSARDTATFTVRSKAGLPVGS
ncbi:MAG: hypothetical protein Q3Y08_10540 [Butyricicoccus sp.]|nr:hypothetical protein [Butyricicoccus sp.]